MAFSAVFVGILANENDDFIVSYNHNTLSHMLHV